MTRKALPVATRGRALPERRAQRRASDERGHDDGLAAWPRRRYCTSTWTRSTNFTPSGFLGQTNVGHRVADPDTARNYLAFWELVKTDPALKDARARTAALTADPVEVIAEKSIARLFSPRAKSTMLGWYGRRMLDAANSVWFTAAFGVSQELIDPIAKKRDQMRFVLLEKPLPAAQIFADRSPVRRSPGVFRIGQFFVRFIVAER